MSILIPVSPHLTLYAHMRSGHICEEKDTETQPLHLAGCLIINLDNTGWLCCPLLGWTN